MVHERAINQDDFLERSVKVEYSNDSTIERKTQLLGVRRPGAALALRTLDAAFISMSWIPKELQQTKRRRAAALQGVDSAV